MTFWPLVTLRNRKVSERSFSSTTLTLHCQVDKFKGGFLESKAVAASQWWRATVTKQKNLSILPE